MQQCVSTAGTEGGTARDQTCLSQGVACVRSRQRVPSAGGCGGGAAAGALGHMPPAGASIGDSVPPPAPSIHAGSCTCHVGGAPGGAAAGGGAACGGGPAAAVSAPAAASPHAPAPPSAAPDSPIARPVVPAAPLAWQWIVWITTKKDGADC